MCPEQRIGKRHVWIAEVRLDMLAFRSVHVPRTSQTAAIQLLNLIELDIRGSRETSWPLS